MRRRVITGATLAVGIVMMLLGYFASAPWAADAVAGSNPRVDFAPTVFVLGVIVAVSAALVYELTRDPKKGR